MASLGDIQSLAFNIMEEINLNRDNKRKTCVIKFPSVVQPSFFANKKFLVNCITGSIEDEMFRNQDYTFTEESIKVTINFLNIEGVKDSTGTYAMPYEGFKNFNCEVYYNKKNYGIEFEKTSEFDNKVILYCNVKK